MSLSASPTLMAVPSSRKTVMSKMSTDDFTKVMLNNSTAQEELTVCTAKV